ncbi:MAG TPA: GDP-mannose 4,6-dehydratase [Anaerolineae bacterium]|nr:GDP-mannose 4,6-dehydratase [Anaerolineae bacterium]HQK13750.1 GDP-mannose 4,6-dehydratase [Anaerolineae bacterium]
MGRQHFLVTGGAGFIGSHLVDALLEAKQAVTVLDDLSVGKEQNIAHHFAHPDFRFVKGSILDKSLVEQLVAAVDGVFHLAAVVGVKYVVEDPLHGMQVNVRGTETVLEAALKRGCKVVLASSSETYGKSPQVPFSEEDNSLLGATSIPRWSYAVSKLLDEHLAFAYYRQNGLPTVAVRYFNAYGPRLDPRGYGSVIARFINQALDGGPITIYGDGEQTRAFTFVKDTVRGTIAAMERAESAGLTFNIGNPREITMNRLARLIQEGLGAEVEIVHVPFAEAYGPDFEDTPRRLPDVRRAKERLGFEATIPLEEGLYQTILWFKEHRHEFIPT